MTIKTKTAEETTTSEAFQFTTSNFKLVNRITGWIVFLIATITYLLTLEPTVSFWDCGEFITSSYKLEVGHPPGAPFFMLLARFFSLFASDVKHVAYMVNTVSGLASAFTILFLFWTITHLARHIIGSKESMNKGNFIAIIGTGVVGALAYTFSDTFWFSAVEGEVYALSSLFTAVVFWAILKWENVANERFSNRWLILIAYLMGLSIGVHLLNLLAIPAIVFVYYFKKYKPTQNGVILAALTAIAILGSIMYVIIPGAVVLATKFELLFTNGFGMPYNTGTYIYLLLVFGSLAFGIYYSIQKSKALMNTILTMITVILVGYSSFALIIIRSNANPPMNQNQPDNVFSLLSYLNRDQYGNRPLVYGQYFNAPLRDYEEGDPIYVQKDGKYEIVDKKTDYKWDDGYKTIFPRMYSSQSSPNHVQGYMNWANIKDKEKKPTFGQNLAFFFKYQVGYMYLRYFMWNFAGRQNDIQGHDANIIHGNWISGIPFIDNARLGPQDKLPDELKNNKGRNKYYFLPLILGLLGMIYMYRKGEKGKQSFWVVMLFFIFTGLAIVVYLNQPPYQPRERDYAYAASFYAFAIWIGFGVMMIYDFLKKHIPATAGAAIASVACVLAAPVLMASQNWDDHDRSGRYTAIDFASNYLNSCKPNAILFTNGDNDTFPLWFAQEVEGIRTDVRVINLSYLSTHWYIDQHKRQAYEAAPTPFSFTYKQYMPGKRDVVVVQEKVKKANVKEVIDFVGLDDKRTKIQSYDGEFDDFIPTKSLFLNVDSADVVNKHVVEPKDANLIIPKLEWNVYGNYIYKNQLMVLDLLANNNWERPIYFAITVGTDGYYNLQDYFQFEGMAYRLVPIKTVAKSPLEYGHINSDILYDNLMNKFKWGNVNDPDVYLDENNLRMLTHLKNNFSRLASKLVEEGKKDSAIAVLDKCQELLPESQIPPTYISIYLAETYYQAGAMEKGNALMKSLAENVADKLDYYLTLPKKLGNRVENEKDHNLAVAQEILRILATNKQEELFQEINVKFQQIYSTQ
jgi:hypothetical protein